MVGGKTLRLVARYADACNLFAAMGADEIRHKLDVPRGHCEDVGRDYEENVHEIDPLETFGEEVIPAVRDL